jgi:hypothetical protein
MPASLFLYKKKPAMRTQPVIVMIYIIALHT